MGGQKKIYSSSHELSGVESVVSPSWILRATETISDREMEFYPTEANPCQRVANNLLKILRDCLIHLFFM